MGSSSAELPSGADSPSGVESRRRFHLAFQRSRMATYLLAYPIAMAFQTTDFLQIGILQLTVVFLSGAFSGLLFYFLYAQRIDRRWSISLEPFWMACDVVNCTWFVYWSGGIASPWFIWYLAITGAAAFAGSRKLAIAVAACNVMAYLGLLIWIGDIRGIGDNLYTAIGRMTLLYGASFFCLRGIMDLKENRRLIKRLRNEDQLRVEELTRLTEALDQRSRQVSEANARIQEANRLKSQFLANMSHELRTPLNSIIGFSHILTDKLAGKIGAQHEKFLRNVLGSGQHLLGLINDLLDISKIEAGRMEIFPEPFDPTAALEAVRTVMHGVAEQKGIQIEIDIPAPLPLVIADGSKFRQVVLNLASNAVKFSPENSVVVIRARYAGAEEPPLHIEALVIEIIDRGVGITSADQGLIFEEFRRSDNPLTRHHSGTGLGLSLVKRLLEIQGGAVHVASEPGQGSTFSIYLPLRSPLAALTHPPSALAAEAEPSGAPSRRKVLIVEDDPAAYHTLSVALESEGYATVNARHSEEALRLIDNEHPAFSFITLDLILPGLDGLEVLKDLKSRASTRDIPVIIVTMAPNRELGLALGADDFFLKPVQRQAFIRRVRELAPLTPEDAGAGLDASRILLVDDDERMHDLLAAEIEPFGYRLLSAYTGAQGIQLARSGRPAVLVLDLMMPGMSGFEVAHELQSDPATARIPIVVLTAKEPNAAERDLLRGRIAALFQKGDAPQSLLATIRELARRHREPVAPAPSEGTPTAPRK